MAERRRSRAPRQFRPTRDGRFYGALTLVVGVGVTNSGNNLLYLVAGLLLALIIVSGVLSEAVLQDLEVESKGTRPGHAGEEGRWWIAVRKRGGSFPSFALTVEALDGPAQGAKGSLFRIAPNSSEEAELRFTGQRRGRFTTQRIRVGTRFPFGLAEKSREFELPELITVYPRQAEASADAGSRPVREGTAPTGRAGAGPEPLALRPWAAGDSLSAMHWRKSAQGRGWVASIRERESALEVAVIVDLSASPDPDSLAGLERRIEQAAATVDAALRRGCLVSLEAGSDRLPAGSGPSHRTRLLEALAAAEPDLRGAS